MDQQPYGNYQPPPPPSPYQGPPSYGNQAPSSPSPGFAPNFNPYAPPSADWVSAPAGVGPGMQQWWFEGETLVVPKGGTLPLDRCVKFGTPADDKPVTRTVQWMHPLIALSVLISPLIMIILYFIFRKTGQITYGQSEQLRKRRSLGLALILGPLLLFGLAFVMPEPARWDSCSRCSCGWFA